MIKGKVEPLVCPYCEFSCKRTKAFEEHVKEEHDLDLCALWNDVHGGPRTCECGCGEVTKFNGYKKGYSKFINGHNAYKKSMGSNAKKIIEKRKKTLKSRIESGDVVPWSKGLTKETDERVRLRAAKSSESIKRSFENGRVQWSKGLTKETDDRVLRRSLSLKKKYNLGDISPWSKGLTEATDERVKDRNDRLREVYRTAQDNSHGSSLDEEFSNTDIMSQLERNIQIRLERIEGYKNKRRPSLIVRCSSCDWTSKVSLVFAKNDRCPRCALGKSTQQREIASWINSLGFNAITNVKGIIGRQKIDIYIPEKSLGVEISSLKWHNEEAGRDSNYQELKTDMSDKYGVFLIHIFEDEWRENKEIVKSIIRSHAGIIDKKYDARKCDVRQLSVKDRKEFFNENHMDGDAISTISWGLYYKDELVSALSLRRPFHKSAHKNSIEVGRFCSLNGTSVRGALGKLMKQAKKYAKEEEYEKILTYVDRRFGDGHGYEKIGFKYVKTTSPRFWWTDFENRFNRFKYRADRSKGMTEAQVADGAGVVRVWGCGNKVYVMDVV